MVKETLGEENREKRTALLSVYHKEGIVEFARALVDFGWDIMASGGTAKALAEAGVRVQDVSDIVGEPMFGHRVVTLSREVHSMIMAEDTPENRAELRRLDLPFIDLVCVDMYPLKEEIDSPNATFDSVKEKTDVGGPTLLHSAAKGRRIVISDPSDREVVLQWLQDGEKDREEFVRNLVAKAEFCVARYIMASAEYLSEGKYRAIFGEKVQDLAYGENRWQKAYGLFKTEDIGDKLALPSFQRVAGQPLGFVNFTDVDRLLQTFTHIAAGFHRNFGLSKMKRYIAVAAKHGNPCGAAVSRDWKEAINNMIAGSPLAIFGGVIVTNIPIGKEEAETLVFDAEGERRLYDCIVAPLFSEEAKKILDWRKTHRCRLVENEHLFFCDELDTALLLRQVRGGFLLQGNYTFVLDLSSSEVTFSRELTQQEKEDVVFAWAIGSTSNSNTIDFVHEGMLLANAVGQQDRVGAGELGKHRAIVSGHEEKLKRAIAYSDSFFPEPDGPEVLGKAGIKVIMTSSGSIKDDATRAICEQYGIALVMIPDALGRGFARH